MDRTRKPDAPGSSPSSHPRARAYLAGGTSVVGAGARPPWLIPAVAGGAAVVLIVAAVLLLGGSDAPPAAELDDLAGEPGEDHAAELDTPAPGAQPARATPARAPERGRVDDASLRQAARELGDTLRTQRLWSTVANDPASPEVVIIRSTLCDDGALQAAVASVLPELRSHGVASVRCEAPHGSVIFERAP